MLVAGGAYSVWGTAFGVEGGGGLGGLSAWGAPDPEKPSMALAQQSGLAQANAAASGISLQVPGPSKPSNAEVRTLLLSGLAPAPSSMLPKPAPAAAFAAAPLGTAPTLPTAANGSSGPCALICKGLPFSATLANVEVFFNDVELAAKNAIRLHHNEHGMPTGECYVLCASEAALAKGLQKNKKVVGHRFVTVERASGAELAKAFPPDEAPSGNKGGANSRTGSQIGSGSPSKAAPSGAAMSLGGGVTLDISDVGATDGGNGCGRNGSGPLAYASAAKGEGSSSHAQAAGVKGGCGTSARGSSLAAANGGGGPSPRGGGDEGSGSGIVVKMRGLPYSASEEEIRTFFSGLRIESGGVTLGRDASGRASGEAHVEFAHDQDAQSAMLLNRHRIGNRYIELFRTKQAPSAQRRTIATVATESLSSGTSDVLRLRGMPFNSNEADVNSFFKGYSLASGGVKLGPQVGQATVRFSHADDAKRALLNLNHSYMGNRYIELFIAEARGEWPSARS